MSSHNESSISPVPKRSLFKKKAVIEPAEEDEALQLFSRSKEIFPDVIAENERRRRDLKNSQNSKTNGSVERTEPCAPDGKKRRISKETEDAGVHSSDDEITTKLLHKRRASRDTTPKPPSALLSSTTPRKDRFESSSKTEFHRSSVDQQESRKSNIPQTTAAVVTLTDSEEEGKPKKTKGRGPPVVDLNLDSDVEDNPYMPPKVVVPPVREVFEVEEFPEYVAKAREGATRSVFGKLDSTQSNARSDSISSNESNTKFEMKGAVQPVSMIPRASDAVVHILVTSQIPGTKPLMVKRKLSQRLKDVKYAWCDKQVIDGMPVSEEVKRIIFLTWRGNKVFDVTSCKSLGVTTDSSGRLRIDGEGFDEEGRIHLEAWTEEIYNEFKKRKAAERKRFIIDPLQEEEEDESEPDDHSTEEQVQKFKIILKTKDRKEFKVQVHSTTPVAKIINAYRNEHKIPGNVNISLYLDGDKLDPSGIVSDVDLEELTTIDVHVG